MPEKREEKGLVDTVVYSRSMLYFTSLILQLGAGIPNAYFFYVILTIHPEIQTVGINQNDF